MRVFLGFVTFFRFTLHWVNHRNNELRAMARELLTGEGGLKHRSKQPIEPEAVFGQIKHDNNFKRFRYRGNKLVKAEFAALLCVCNQAKLTLSPLFVDYA